MRIHRTLLTLALLLAVAPFAEAHAFIDHAEPKVGSKVLLAPKAVKIWFTQKLVIAFSNLQVFDARGSEVDARDKHLDKTDQALLIVSLPPLKAGKYKVVWRAVSVDTHVTQGDFPFEVATAGGQHP
jgi:methionine-rich copper-binding protein CopC